jgi:CheY-like chemotaxis protein
MEWGLMMQDNPWLDEINTPGDNMSSGTHMDELQELYDHAPCGYHSPDENGLFVRINKTELSMLGKLDPQVQIIAMSGLATNESVSRTMGEGVQAFIAKPFTALELLNILSRLCNRH